MPRAPSPGWWRGPLSVRGPGARAPASRGGASPAGFPLTMSPGLVPGRLAPQRCDAPCKAGDCAPPSGSMAGRFCCSGPCVAPPSASAPWPFGTEGRSRRCRRLLSGAGRRFSCGALRLAWIWASCPSAACDEASNEGATHDADPPCVVVIGFDETQRLPSRRFRRASEVVCTEPCRWGLEPGVTARRRGSSLWVILLDLPVGMSPTQRIRVTVHGFLHKTGVSGSYRRIG